MVDTRLAEDLDFMEKKWKQGGRVGHESGILRARRIAQQGKKKRPWSRRRFGAGGGLSYYTTSENIMRCPPCYVNTRSSF